MPTSSLLILIIINIYGKYKLWGWSLCSYFHPPATLCLKYLWGYAILWKKKKCLFVFNDFSAIAILVPIVCWKQNRILITAHHKMYFRRSISCLLSPDIPPQHPALRHRQSVFFTSCTHPRHCEARHEPSFEPTPSCSCRLYGKAKAMIFIEEQSLNKQLLKAVGGWGLREEGGWSCKRTTKYRPALCTGDPAP